MIRCYIQQDDDAFMKKAPPVNTSWVTELIAWGLLPTPDLGRRRAFLTLTAHLVADGVAPFRLT